MTAVIIGVLTDLHSPAKGVGMDDAERVAAVTDELPAVLAGLARRFPATRVTTDDVRQAAEHRLRQTAGRPCSRPTA